MKNRVAGYSGLQDCTSACYLGCIILVLTLFGCMNSQPNKEEAIKSNQDTTYTYSGDTLAFKLIGNHIISDVTIMDSLKVKAIFDTGAFQMNVDSTFAKEHNLIKGNLTKPGSRERIEYIKSLSKLGSRKSSIQLNGIFDSIPASIMNLHKIIGDKALRFL